MRLTQGKEHRLCSQRLIDSLYDRSNPGNHTAVAYPLRAIWRLTPGRVGETPAAAQGEAALEAATGSGVGEPTATSSGVGEPTAPSCGEKCDKAMGSGVGEPNDVRAQFAISIAKRSLRKAVDRVRMRRLIREAWRLNHRDILPRESGNTAIVALLYIGREKHPWSHIAASMRRLLTALAEDLTIVKSEE